MVVRRNLFIDKRKPKENQKKPTSERRQMALSRGGAEGRTAGPLGFGPHLRPLCGPPLQQQHDFWSSPVSVGSLGTPWSFVIILRATPSAPPWASPRYTSRGPWWHSRSRVGPCRTFSREVAWRWPCRCGVGLCRDVVGPLTQSSGLRQCWSESEGTFGLACSWLMG